MLLNDVRTLLITVQLQLSLYEGCRRVQFMVCFWFCRYVYGIGEDLENQDVQPLLVCVHKSFTNTRLFHKIIDKDKMIQSDNCCIRSSLMYFLQTRPILGQLLHKTCQLDQYWFSCCIRQANQTKLGQLLHQTSQLDQYWVSCCIRQANQTNIVSAVA